MQRVSLQAGFILHHRLFRESSVIADVLTPDYGRVSVVARGARSARSKLRPLIQPFRPLLVSWTGRSDLKTLTGLEEQGLPVALSGHTLACGYYLSELLLRLLPSFEAAPIPFACYARSLSELEQLQRQRTALASARVDEAALPKLAKRRLPTGELVAAPPSAAGRDPGEDDGEHGADENSAGGNNVPGFDQTEMLLRRFELDLLDALGLLPDLAHCAVDGEPVDVDAVYRFDALRAQATRIGFGSARDQLSKSAPASVPHTQTVSGLTLLALAERDLSDVSLLPETKRIMRLLLQIHLGDQPLRSRELFRQLAQRRSNRT